MLTKSLSLSLNCRFPSVCGQANKSEGCRAQLARYHLHHLFTILYLLIRKNHHPHLFKTTWCKQRNSSHHRHLDEWCQSNCCAEQNCQEARTLQEAVPTGALIPAALQSTAVANLDGESRIYKEVSQLRNSTHLSRPPEFEPRSTRPEIQIRLPPIIDNWKIF